MGNEIFEAYSSLLKIKNNLYSKGEENGENEEDIVNNLCDHVIEVYSKYSDDEIVNDINKVINYTFDLYFTDMAILYTTKGSILLNKSFEEKAPNFEEAKECFFKAKNYSTKTNFDELSKKSLTYYIGLSLLFNFEVVEATIILKSLYKDGFLSKENIDAANAYLENNNIDERVVVD